MIIYLCCDHCRSDDFKIPQLDGAFNSPPKKQTLKRGNLKTNTPRSPPKSSKKYAPLDIVITKSPAVKCNDFVSTDLQKIQLKV